MNNNKTLCSLLQFCLVVALMLFVISTDANAQTTITTILCNITNQISGPIGKAIAILIVISIAMGLFVGKITWGIAIAVAVGMGILFGAANIVGLISGGGANYTCGS